MAELANIVFDTNQAEQVAQLFLDAPEIAGDEFKRALTESLALLENQVKERTPLGVGGRASGLAGSISTALSGQAVDLQGKVFSSYAYAEAVELGTKPHFPPVVPLIDWAEAILDLSREQARQVGYLIALKISHRGTKGKHMFEGAFTDNKGKVLSMFGDAIDRITNRLGR